MAQAREKGGRVVFIGNIPYGVSEEQICEIFGRIGSVVSFRLVYDKETGKPKGFGFLEYNDVDQAAAAVRNLNGFDVMGRSLKVDYSNDNSGGKNTDSNRAPPPAHMDMNGPSAMNGAAPDGSSADLPPLPQGVELPPGMTAPDAISKTLQAIPPPQLIDILSQMKGLVATDPAKATAILQQAPQLSYAVFQALLLLGLVDTSILATLIQQTQTEPQPPMQPPQPVPQPLGSMSYPPQPLQAYQQPPSYAPQPQAPPPNIYGQYQPPPQQYSQLPQTYQPPPQPQPPPQQSSPDDLRAQVLALTREQIFSMPPDSRDQIINLRMSMGAPVV